MPRESSRLRSGTVRPGDGHQSRRTPTPRPSSEEESLGDLANRLEADEASVDRAADSPMARAYTPGHPEYTPELITLLECQSLTALNKMSSAAVLRAARQAYKTITG